MVPSGLAIYSAGSSAFSSINSGENRTDILLSTYGQLPEISSCLQMNQTRSYYSTLNVKMIVLYQELNRKVKISKTGYFQNRI